MSPLEIKVLLHIYALVRDYRDEHALAHSKSAALKQTFSQFLEEGLISKRYEDFVWEAINPNERDSQYRITEKGVAMVNHLCAVQIPICKWVQP